MNAGGSAIVLVALLAFAGATPAQIKTVGPKPLASPARRSIEPLLAPAPAQSVVQPAQQPPSAASPAETEQPSSAGSAAEAQPARSLGISPGSGGSLLGSPLPPPPEVPQGAADAMKEDVSTEPAEVVVASASMQEAQKIQQQAQGLGMGVKRRTALNNLGLVVSVLRVPAGTSVADAVAQLRQALPGAWVDANHRYRLEAGPARIHGAKPGSSARARGCQGALAIGLVDTAIDVANPALRSKSVTVRSFLTPGVAAAPAQHGTEIASLLVRDGTGLAPGAVLHAAAVFRLRGERDVDTTAELVVRALDWLVEEKVAVVNLGFDGPSNQLVEAALLRLGQLGIQAVAGRCGPG